MFVKLRKKLTENLPEKSFIMFHGKIMIGSYMFSVLLMKYVNCRNTYVLVV